MNLSDVTTGLRNLPLSQYLLRGSVAAAQYDVLRLLQDEQAAVAPVLGGPFRVFNLDRKERDLLALGMTRDSFLQELSKGIEVFDIEPTTDKGRSIIGSIAGGQIEVRLLLDPELPPGNDVVVLGQSDWTLQCVRRNTLGCPSGFGRVDARWDRWRHNQAPLDGNAEALLRDLVVLQNRVHERSDQIQIVRRQLDGDSPELSERIATWRRVCELEQDLSEVGVTRLQKLGEDDPVITEPHYVLIPEQQDEVQEWIEQLEAEKPEGVTWEHHKLKLTVGEDFALLGIESITVEADELVLKVCCRDSKGRALLDRLCDGFQNGDKLQPELYLPDSQLRRIGEALDVLDPNQQIGPQQRAIAEHELDPDDTSVRTLQGILSEPSKLEPISQPWPELPTPPLFQLSPRQEEAVRAAVFSPDMVLIQGPPGTGKTTVILEILRQLFRAHGKVPSFRVLLVAPTHVAVDNVLERLVAPRRGVNLLTELGVGPYRVGSTRKIAHNLRACTPDCLNTEYRGRLEDQVARDALAAREQLKLDRLMLDILGAGAEQDKNAWTTALSQGELPEMGWRSVWPHDLDPEWAESVTGQDGRASAWKHWHTRGTSPEDRLRFLEHWLNFLQTNPRFFSELLLANANLVCATTIGCATREVRAAVYDYVIVDEAGKEEARRLLVPLIRGERWVLVGDHQQLPPYADDSLKRRLSEEGLDPEIVTRSLFEELEGPFKQIGRYVFLDRQGRMHPDISGFVSHFYGGELGDFPHASEQSIPCPSFLPMEPRLLVLDTGWLRDPSEQPNERGYGFFNASECELTIHLLRSFARLPCWHQHKISGANSGPFSIGVIAPYKRQVEELVARAEYDAVLKQLIPRGSLQIGTVDSFQGQEKDLIIFSSTRSNDKGAFGFADNRQRLNVALSRARARLIVLIDGSTVKRAEDRIDRTASEAKTSHDLSKLLEYSRSRGGFLPVPSDWKAKWRV